jgi:hypothetical protein
MGVAYFIVLERQIDGLDTAMDGKRLAKIAADLDAVASQLGVKPISEFISIDTEQVAEAMDMDLSDIQVTPPEQFSAIHDLKDCERILSVAAKHGVSWRFEIDV